MSIIDVVCSLVILLALACIPIRILGARRRLRETQLLIKRLNKTIREAEDE